MELLAAFNEGKLAEEQMSELENAIEMGLLSIDEMPELMKIDQQMDAIEVPEPGANMDQQFYQMLGKHKAKAGTNWLEALDNWLANLGLSPSAVRLAYGMVLLVVGFGVGVLFNGGSAGEIDKLSAEMKDMKAMMMLTMLEKESATERLKAVSISNEITDVDDQVINALLQTLNYDDNVNVRIATLEALFRYADKPAVREGLVKAIAHQDSPLVMVALAEVMVVLQEKGSVDELQKIIDHGHLDEGVEEKLTESIQKLI